MGKDETRSLAQDLSVRIGDAERAAALDILDEAYALGKLTPDEHRSRCDAAREARTGHDLDILVGDLLGQPPTQPSRPIRPLRVFTILTQRTLSSPFPQQLRATGASVELLLRSDDFTDGTFALNMQCQFAYVLLGIPEGTRILDQMTRVLSGTHYRRSSAGTPRYTVQLTGLLVCSQVHILGERPAELHAWFRRSWGQPQLAWRTAEPAQKTT